MMTVDRHPAIPRRCGYRPVSPAKAGIARPSWRLRARPAGIVRATSHHLRAAALIRTALICGLILGAILAPAAAMPDSALVALKQAGFSDAVIQAVSREKVIETAAFTVEELIALKNAGMTDETLEILVTERSFMRQAQPVVYGRAVKPLNMSSVQDLVELKQSGLSDDVIKALIIASSQSRGQEYDRAWDMLNRLGLEIEIRP